MRKSDEFKGKNVSQSVGSVSYTHMTLPTNREVTISDLGEYLTRKNTT